MCDADLSISLLVLFSYWCAFVSGVLLGVHIVLSFVGA